MALNDIVTGSNLGPEFELGTNVADAITINVDGVTVLRDPVTGELSSPAAAQAVSAITYDAATTTLTHDPGDGSTPVDIDLSALTTDIFVDGATFDAATSILTLKDNDGATPDVTIDLSTLLGVSTDADNLLSNGADGKPFIDGAAVCAEITANCLEDCPVTDVFGNTIGTAQQLQ